MAANASSNPTLIDWARRIDPNGQVATVVGTLNEYNEILDDMTFIEGNLPTGHKVTVAASLPTPTWRLLNQGVTPAKGTTNQITETCGMLEAYSRIDKALAGLNGNTAEFRYSEDTMHIESLNQALSTALIYGDTSVNPEQFVGLSPRYYSISAGTCYGNVINASGSGATNTSVWLVGWSPQTVMGIFPKGSQAGMQVKDLGEQIAYDANSNPYQAYITHFKWDVGMAVKDWRYVVRIANISISDLETAGDASDTSTNLLKHMSIAMDKLPSNGIIRPVFYCNQRVMAMLRVKFLSKSNVQITLNEMLSPATGLKRPNSLSFMGVPIRRIDKIVNTETALT